MDIVYPCKNTRECYWLCRECFKGHSHKCSPKCPDYLSIAVARRQREYKHQKRIEAKILLEMRKNHE